MQRMDVVSTGRLMRDEAADEDIAQRALEKALVRDSGCGAR